jgi:hypothetical protein
MLQMKGRAQNESQRNEVQQDQAEEEANDDDVDGDDGDVLRDTTNAHTLSMRCVNRDRKRVQNGGGDTGVLGDRGWTQKAGLATVNRRAARQGHEGQTWLLIPKVRTDFEVSTKLRSRLQFERQRRANYLVVCGKTDERITHAETGSATGCCNRKCNCCALSMRITTFFSELLQLVDDARCCVWQLWIEMDRQLIDLQVQLIAMIVALKVGLERRAKDEHSTWMTVKEKHLLPDDDRCVIRVHYSSLFGEQTVSQLAPSHKRWSPEVDGSAFVERMQTK